MIDKIEYGDFNKFLVSTGYLLIAVGLLLPYFYLKENFDLQIEQEKIKGFTITAQKILNAKQSFALNLINVIPYLSIFSISIGTVFLSIGGYKWKNKQNIEDEKINEEISKLKKENRKADYDFDILKKGEKIPQEEVIKNKEIEIEIEQPNISSIEKTVSAQSYYLLENLISEKLRKEYSNKYNVLTNYKINNQEYDVILTSIDNNISKTGLNLSKDIIVEIKYTSRQINKRYVLDTLTRVAELIKRYPTAITNPVIIFVRTNSEQSFDENKIRKEIIEEWSEKTIRKWNIVFTTLKDISDLEFKTILNI